MELIFDLNLNKIFNSNLLTNNLKAMILGKGGIFLSSGEWPQGPEVFVEKQVIFYRRSEG
jgi:hypothetical protein